MVEYPGSWNRLTAALSVADLDDIDLTWEFLVSERLVRAEPDQRTELTALVESARSTPPIPGPSLPYSLASAMSAAGVTTIECRAEDPFAELASRRWREFLVAQGRDVEPDHDDGSTGDPFDDEASTGGGRWAAWRARRRRRRTR